MKFYILDHYTISERSYKSRQDLSVVAGACGRFIEVNRSEIPLAFCGKASTPEGAAATIGISQAWDLIQS